MTERHTVQTERERQSQTVIDEVWAVSVDGETLNYRLADHTPENGYSRLADIFSRYIDEDAVLDALRGSNDYQVVGHAELDADTGEVKHLDIAQDVPRL